MECPPVFKNGINMGTNELNPGDIIFIEMIHLIPMGGFILEPVRACAFFRFEEWREPNPGQLFILGYGLHFDLEEDEVPTDISSIDSYCIKRIRILTAADYPAFIFARTLLNLSDRNRALAEENTRLTGQNAQLMASHFGGVDTIQ